ncbi:MAG: tRNA (adenosine(37)-N6)-threonylcarbamoyltransferase complex ATPase subunit type 1 TsaE, partial [Lachnospiraceae bacterium]|nr:tRNA (adenosine(37)-N6)-threonylcarbamoyltransferase complex ATPase subunit type 1 TsaE [Lachnospiraceae bacterium]
MKKRIVETFRPEETQKLGQELAKEAAPGTVITLNGDLGVGKTVFAQGIAMGLDLDEWINSPTFTIVQEYDGGRMPFY